MTWQPGQPVATERDRQEWEQWRRDRKREQQRQRRATNRRIDYYPDNEAAAVIDTMWTLRIGGDYSSVINRMVIDWAQTCRLSERREKATLS